MFSLTLATDTLVCLSTLSGVDSYDTVLHVRTECNDSLSEVESPVAIGCNDDSGDWDNDDRCDLGVGGCSLQSEMTLRAEGGQTYYIVVDGDG